MIAYLDTSALLKLFLPDEEGADITQRVWEAADRIVTSSITYLEARAALAAAARAKRLSAGAHESAKEHLSTVLGQVDTIELSNALARSAGDVAEVHALRAADALHLTSALEASVDPLVLLTWDRTLARAAITEGLSVVPSP